jgi:hypothetical protein
MSKSLERYINAQGISKNAKGYYTRKRESWKRNLAPRCLQFRRWEIGDGADGAARTLARFKFEGFRFQEGKCTDFEEKMPSSTMMVLVIR